MHDLMSRIRRIVEGLLPWYDPQVEAARDAQTKELLRKTRAQAHSVGAYGRVRITR
jgi:hypothetical protein